MANFDSIAMQALWLRTFNEEYMKGFGYERSLALWFFAHDASWQGPLWPSQVMSLVDAMLDWVEKQGNLHAPS